jgi:hypothetical protein
MIRSALLALLLICTHATADWFVDVGLGYNLDNPHGGQDFEGGREVALLGAGYEWHNGWEIGYQHLSHWLRGWPGEDYLGWSGDEEKIDMLYIKKRFRW